MYVLHSPHAVVRIAKNWHIKRMASSTCSLIPHLRLGETGGLLDCWSSRPYDFQSARFRRYWADDRTMSPMSIVS